MTERGKTFHFWELPLRAIFMSSENLGSKKGKWDMLDKKIRDTRKRWGETNLPIEIK